MLSEAQDAHGRLHTNVLEFMATIRAELSGFRAFLVDETNAVRTSLESQVDRLTSRCTAFTEAVESVQASSDLLKRGVVESLHHSDAQLAEEVQAIRSQRHLVEAQVVVLRTLLASLEEKRMQLDAEVSTLERGRRELEAGVHATAEALQREVDGVLAIRAALGWEISNLSSQLKWLGGAPDPDSLRAAAAAHAEGRGSPSRTLSGS